MTTPKPSATPRWYFWFATISMIVILVEYVLYGISVSRLLKILEKVR
jgi:hypothetical protein